MLRAPALARASLIVTCLLLAPASPALAQPPNAPGSGPHASALLVGAVLLGLAAVGWVIATRSTADRQRERAERERIAALLASLERQQLARYAERERQGLRRRRRNPSTQRPQRGEYHVSFRTASHRDERRGPLDDRPSLERVRSRPTAAPIPATAKAPAEAPAEATAMAPVEATVKAPVEAEATKTPKPSEAPETPALSPPGLDRPSEPTRPPLVGTPAPIPQDRRASLLAAIAAAKRRLESLSATLEQVEGAPRDGGPTARAGGTPTLNLGSLEFPDLDASAFEGLLEVQGGETLRLGPLELPDQLGPETLVLVPDEFLARLQALADVAIPEGSFTPVIAPSVPRPPTAHTRSRAS